MIVMGTIFTPKQVRRADEKRRQPVCRFASRGRIVPLRKIRDVRACPESLHTIKDQGSGWKGQGVLAPAYRALVANMRTISTARRNRGPRRKLSNV